MLDYCSLFSLLTEPSAKILCVSIGAGLYVSVSTHLVCAMSLSFFTTDKAGGENN